MKINKLHLSLSEMKNAKGRSPNELNQESTKILLERYKPRSFSTIGNMINREYQKKEA